MQKEKKALNLKPPFMEVKLYFEKESQRLRFDYTYLEKYLTRYSSIGPTHSMKRQALRLLFLTHVSEFCNELMSLMNSSIFNTKGVSLNSTLSAQWIEFQKIWQVEFRVLKKIGFSLQEFFKIIRQSKSNGNPNKYIDSLSFWILDNKNINPQCLYSLPPVSGEKLDTAIVENSNEFYIVKIPKMISKGEIETFIRSLDEITEPIDYINIDYKLAIEIFELHRNKEMSFQNIARLHCDNTDERRAAFESRVRTFRHHFKTMIKIVDPPIYVKRK